MSQRFFKRYFDILSSFSAAQITVISFLVMSLVGGSLLWYTEHSRVVEAKIPVHTKVVLTQTSRVHTNYYPRQETHTTTASITYHGERFVDTLFTAVSALCVTGLISTDFSQFTLLGQVITMILIQMGGLGIIVFTSLFAMAITRGISEHANFRKLLSGILDTQEDYVRNMIKHVILYTVFFEGLGAFIMGAHLAWDVSPKLYGNINPWWWGLFHAVSAFNNAGFGLLNNNIVNFATDPVISLTIAFLIILGGLGYPVLIAIHIFIRSKIMQQDKFQKRLIQDMKLVAASAVQVRVALVGTISLLLLGTIFPLIEASNRAMLSHYSLPQQILITFFQSASTRTAGFNSIDIGSMGTATLFLYIIFMFIGTNPAGTGGGIKIPTVAVLYGYLKDWFHKPGLPVTLLGKKVSKFAVAHAIRLFFLATVTVFGITFLIAIIEDPWLITPDPTFNFLKIFFEVVSAFGTVGLTMGFPGGVTSFSALLAPLSKLLLIAAMLIGRLGPLTLLAALPWKKEPDAHDLTPDYPDAEKIQIG